VPLDGLLLLHFPDPELLVRIPKVLEDVALGNLNFEFLYLLLGISSTLFEVFLPYLHVRNVFISKWIVDRHLLNDVVKRRSLSYIDWLSP
jgi:hypothetical protein